MLKEQFTEMINYEFQYHFLFIDMNYVAKYEPPNILEMLGRFCL